VKVLKKGVGNRPGLLVAKSFRRPWPGAILILCAALILLPSVVHLDGRMHGDWEQFLGRFHPLAVHLPIGLLLLVPIFELLGRSRPALREAAGFVLNLAVAACLGTLCLGYLLAHGAGQASDTVIRHMWGAIALTISVLLCHLARRSWTLNRRNRLYPWLLACMLGVLVWTAHQGGALTHGDDYLREFMPAWMKKVGGVKTVEASASSPTSFYAMQVNPIFDKNCVSCHGRGKTQGGLRLDSYERLIRGGHDGAVIVSGRPDQSLLLKRITLPKSDKHFMPAEHPPLSSRDIRWIRSWVEQGASPTTVSLAGIIIAPPLESVPIHPVGDYSGLAESIRTMQTQPGPKLLPVSSKPSDGLILSTVDVASDFGDTQLSTLAKFAPYVVEADLARTGITDASIPTLSTFTNLRALHLEGTSITGSNLGKLTSLTQLRYLNVSHTKITAQSLQTLQTMKNLKHVYAFDTPAETVEAQGKQQYLVSTTKSQ
jgi:uncharacterized membrane protein